MSEKYDGVRAYWNGRTIIFRQGKQLSCPPWFIENFPTSTSLDGELWLGHGNFELTIATLSSNVGSHAWKTISFVVFDLPSSEEPFETRARDLANLSLPNHVCIAEILKCRGKDHLQEHLVQILENGGEGLMVNKPNSSYISMRTDNLLKVKVFFLTIEE
jgi:DNA ligase-1